MYIGLILPKLMLAPYLGVGSFNWEERSKHKERWRILCVLWRKLSRYSVQSSYIVYIIITIRIICIKVWLVHLYSLSLWVFMIFWTPTDFSHIILRSAAAMSCELKLHNDNDYYHLYAVARELHHLTANDAVAIIHILWLAGWDMLGESFLWRFILSHFLLTGSPPSKVYGQMRAVAQRMAEKFWYQAWLDWPTFQAYFPSSDDLFIASFSGYWLYLWHAMTIIACDYQNIHIIISSSLPLAQTSTPNVFFLPGQNCSIVQCTYTQHIVYRVVGVMVYYDTQMIWLV